MLHFLEARTIYFIAGLMYFIMPLIVWASLRKERSKSVHLWSLGGGFFGVGLFLFALRLQVPASVSFEVANTLICIGGLLRVRAMHHLDSQPGALTPVLLVGLLHTTGYVLSHQFLSQWPLFFVWALLFIAFEYGWISLLAHRIGREQELSSLNWVSIAYVPMVLLLIAQAIYSALHLHISINIITVNNTNILIGLLGIFAAVASNTSFLAMFAERATHERERAARLDVQRKATETLARQLSEMDRQRSLHTMAAALSHELGQPLSTIQMLTDIWRTTPQQADPQQLLSQISSSADQALGVLQRMRGLIKIDASTYQPLELLAIHQQVMLLLDPWLKLEHATIELIEPANLHVKGDPVQLAQVLINIYRNAVQAAANQDHAHIRVRMLQQGDHAIIRIQDNGPGFSPEVLDKLQQSVLYSTKNEGMGMGIGLTLTRNLISQHQGSLHLSNNPEGGACTEVHLPLLSKTLSSPNTPAK